MFPKQHSKTVGHLHQKIAQNLFSIVIIIKYASLKTLRGGIFNKKLIGMHLELFLLGHSLQRKCNMLQLLPSQKKLSSFALVSKISKQWAKIAPLD